MFGKKKNNEPVNTEFAETVRNLTNIDLNHKPGDDLEVEDLDSLKEISGYVSEQEDTSIELMQLCESKNTVRIGEDTDEYTMNIPYTAMVTIADDVDSLPVKDFRIASSPVVYTIDNSKKDHILHKNPNGIFDAAFTYITEKSSGFNEITAEVSVSIPVRPFKVEDNESPYDKWFVLVTNAAVVASFTTKEPVSPSLIKNTLLYAAKSVFERSMKSELANILMSGKASLPNIFPAAIDDIKPVFTEEVTTFTCKYTTSDARIDNMTNEVSVNGVLIK